MDSLLKYINKPDDLRKLGIEQLGQVCAELREFIIDESSRNPGHFGASLGTVELTIALHYALQTPRDTIVWDVGHQAYGHKIITGRQSAFHTNRKLGGISGFPNPEESEYDSFAVGHSSTSVSVALGMAIAAKQNGDTNRQIVAVIGDGSLTGGMAFEALNHAGFAQANLLVILNDNNMAIDANVGALNQYLLDITTSKTYNKLKDETWNLLQKLSKFGPNALSVAQKFENAAKAIILKESNLFESLNFRYFGPVDGHDVFHLSRLIQDLSYIQGPKLLHIRTQKGKGFKPAEESQTTWHAPGKFDKITGKIHADSTPKPPRYQDVFGQTLVDLARQNSKVVGITPAMASGCSMIQLMEEFPERTFDVGIAEQHAVTLAAAMAKEGLVPFCNIYSTFMQRAYDQVIHDTALQKLPVIFCLDRAGLVGADGATHHGVFDIPFMRAIPHLTIASPLNEHELRDLMFTAHSSKKPFVIRYPRGRGQFIKPYTDMKQIAIGKGTCVVEGNDTALLTFGPIGNTAIAAGKYIRKTTNLTPAIYNMRFVKPLDTELLDTIFKSFAHIITIEDSVLTGGFGSAIIEYACGQGHLGKIYRMGIPDEFITHGTQEELYSLCKLDKDSIVEKVLSL
ncbi:MAG: 1-deoxy-D-xylulose-5-phosphate synthase [Bacteroidales bacterium]|nr:1-deoxy-D-xylulose-5-phosphate synthase [Bacteroidales bacterium]